MSNSKRREIKTPTVTAGICAYNEEASIERVVLNILHQPMLDDFVLSEVLVVASGCTDKTEQIVKRLSKENSKVKLITEKSKRGKASAINLILREAVGDIVVLTDADVLPASRSLINLFNPFQRDENVGAVGGRPLPMDAVDNFWGFVAHLIWTRMQNELLAAEVRQGIFFQLSGYLCAFKTHLIDQIPLTACAEDKYMGETIRRQGHKVLYEPQAIVYIHGPKSIRDFLTQRVRVLIGHLQVKRWFGLEQVSTSSPSKTISAFLRTLDFFKPKEILWAGLAAGLECCAALLARYYFATGNLPYNWQTVPTTKPKKFEAPYNESISK